MLYNKAGGVPSEVAARLRVDWTTLSYEPVIYMSDFWHLKKDLIALNETLENQSLNLTLNFKNFGAYWFQLQQNFEKQHAVQKEWGL